jgi:hypothetical protein
MLANFRQLAVLRTRADFGELGVGRSEQQFVRPIRPLMAGVDGRAEILEREAGQSCRHHATELCAIGKERCAETFRGERKSQRFTRDRDGVEAEHTVRTRALDVQNVRRVEHDGAAAGLRDAVSKPPLVALGGDAVRLDMPERHRAPGQITFDLGVGVARAERIDHQRAAQLKTSLLRIRLIVQDAIQRV